MSLVNKMVGSKQRSVYWVSEFSSKPPGQHFDLCPNTNTMAILKETEIREIAVTTSVYAGVTNKTVVVCKQASSPIVWLV